MIKQRLMKAGITEDIDVLAKKQIAEKNIEVKENLQKIKELPELIKEIKAVMRILLKEKKIDNSGIKTILNNHEIESPDNITDIETAKEILKELNAKK